VKRALTYEDGAAWVPRHGRLNQGAGAATSTPCAATLQSAGRRVADGGTDAGVGGVVGTTGRANQVAAYRAGRCREAEAEGARDLRRRRRGGWLYLPGDSEKRRDNRRGDGGVGSAWCMLVPHVSGWC